MPEIAVSRQDIFPTTIWSFDLAYLQPYFPLWLDAVRQWRAAQPQAGGRGRRGWTSEPTLFQQQAFEPLHTAAQAAFGQALQEMQLPGAIRFRVEGWIGVHDEGGFSMPRIQPNRLLSGCFTLQAPEGSAPLLFRDPRPAVALGQVAGRGFNGGGMTAAQPLAGQLLVFPNWLEHQIEPHPSATPRVAIGMNAVAA
ncbi:putative 2OG-Fe(II) oxygenase [Pseudoduganella namucuonensis]|uniref:2OG-Fe(II) oxygenase n=1 Tax=Pseudoduganella namucuonensis TaxID=1035707 RepID=A0A1I7HV76_9BURK|nr:putative 2OG-Fe(II) oxygenase [Pseudoduganella namucuonensis]SFU64634.1 conserved hypothetical protein [Pseudoduganella namucuonensis]